MPGGIDQRLSQGPAALEGPAYETCGRGGQTLNLGQIARHQRQSERSDREIPTCLSVMSY